VFDAADADGAVGAGPVLSSGWLGVTSPVGGTVAVGSDPRPSPWVVGAMLWFDPP
jgi:hypothetical protein